jgi:hypothetical protein
MEARAAGGHNYSIEIVFLNILLDQSLPGVGTSIVRVLGNHHAGQSGRIFSHLRGINYSRDVRPAVAYVDSDPDDLLAVGTTVVSHSYLLLSFTDLTKRDR